MLIYYNIYLISLIMYICMQYACTSDSNAHVCMSVYVYKSLPPFHMPPDSLAAMPWVWHLFSKTHGKEVKNPFLIKLTWSLCMQIYANAYSYMIYA